MFLTLLLWKGKQCCLADEIDPYLLNPWAVWMLSQTRKIQSVVCLHGLGKGYPDGRISLSTSWSANMTWQSLASFLAGCSVSVELPVSTGNSSRWFELHILDFFGYMNLLLQKHSFQLSFSSVCSSYISRGAWRMNAPKEGEVNSTAGTLYKCFQIMAVWKLEFSAECLYG